MNMEPRKPLIATPAEDRGRLAAERPGEFKFEDTLDYIKFVSGRLRMSSMKQKDVAANGGISGSTVGNMASGKTRYPRFGTITGILGSLGYETVIRGGLKAAPVEPKAPPAKAPTAQTNAMLRAITTRKP